MYIVTAFALNYSTQNLGLPRELFLNIGLLVGGLSCLTIPCFAWLADRFGRRRILYHRGADRHFERFPFFMALESQSVFWILFFALMLANIAHDMVVCVQQPMFTELFGASYRYSGAGVGYQVASVVGGGFTVYCRGAGHLLRRIVAQRGPLSDRRMPAVSAHRADDEKAPRRLTHQRRA